MGFKSLDRRDVMKFVVILMLCVVASMADLTEYVESVNIESFTLEDLTFSVAMHGYNVTRDGIVFF